MITVYGAPPTRALRVIWMLEEMGLPYEMCSVDFAKRFDNAEFLEASPTGSFPAIRDGNVCMMESCAILEYLGAKHGPTALTPTRADAHYPAYLAFLHFGEGSLSGPLNVTIATQFFAPEDQKNNWGSQLAIDMFVRKSAALRGPLGKHEYLAGEAFTAADISCGYALVLAQHLGFDDKLDSTVRAYSARLSERPAFQRAISKAQPISA